eukprot:1334857-Amorphochlora_amoeboformis.AAC.1
MGFRGTCEASMVVGLDTEDGRGMGWVWMAVMLPPAPVTEGFRRAGFVMAGKCVRPAALAARCIARFG